MISWLTNLYKFIIELTWKQSMKSMNDNLLIVEEIKNNFFDTFEPVMDAELFDWSNWYAKEKIIEKQREEEFLLCKTQKEYDDHWEKYKIYYNDREKKWYTLLFWQDTTNHIEFKYRVIINNHMFEQWNQYYNIDDMHEIYYYGIDSLENCSHIEPSKGLCIPIKYEIKDWLNKNVGKGKWEVMAKSDVIIFGFDKQKDADCFANKFCV